MKYKLTQVRYINQDVGNLTEEYFVEADKVDIHPATDVSHGLVLFYRDNQTVAAFNSFLSIVEYKEGEDPHAGSQG